MAELATSILLRLKDEVTAPLRGIVGAFEQFGHQVEKAGKSMAMSANMKLARDNFKDVAEGIKEFTERPKELAMETEEAFVGLQRATGLTGDSFEDLKKKTEALGAGSKFGYAELAQGLTTLTQRGATASQALQELHPMELLAEAGGISLAAAIDSTSLVMKRFQLDASQASNVTDLIAMAARAGGTSIGKMGPAFEQTAGFANALGVNVQTTAGMLAAFTQASGSTEKATSALNAAFEHMASPRGVHMVKLGLEAIFGAGVNVKEKMSDLPKLFEDVTKRTKEMGLNGQATSTIFRAIFGTPEIAAMMKAMGPEGMSGMIAKMREAKGETLEEAEAMGKTGKEAHEKMTAAVERLRDAIGEKLIPGARSWDAILTGLADRTTAWVNAHPELIKDLMLTVGAVGKLAGGIAAVLPIIAAVSGAKGLLQIVNALKTLTAASITAAAPWAALTAGILAAYWAYTKWVQVFQAADQLKKSQADSDKMASDLKETKLRLAMKSLPQTELVATSATAPGSIKGVAAGGAGDEEPGRSAEASAAPARKAAPEARSPGALAALRGQLGIKISVDSEGRPSVTQVDKSGDVGFNLDAGLAGLSP